jgi:hypothetical protein
MALTYASQSGELTNLLSSADRIWWDRNALPTAVSNNGMLFAMNLIDGGPDSAPSFKGGIKKIPRVTGQQILLRHMAELETFTGVADGNQGDPDTTALNPNAFGGQLFDWGHFYAKKRIPSSENTLIRGEAAHGMSWREEIMKQMAESWYDKLDTGMMSADTDGRTTIAGLRGLVVNTGTIGGINYATAGNEGFQSSILTRTNLTLDDVTELQLTMQQKGAFAGSQQWGIGVGGLTPFFKLIKETRGLHLFNDDRWDYFKGGQRVGYGNTMFCYDHKGSDTDLFILDPRAARLYLDEAGPQATGPIVDQTVKDGYGLIFLFNYFVQFLVYSRWAGRIQSITG